MGVCNDAVKDEWRVMLMKECVDHVGEYIYMCVCMGVWAVGRCRGKVEKKKRQERYEQTRERNKYRMRAMNEIDD